MYDQKGSLSLSSLRYKKRKAMQFIEFDLYLFLIKFFTVKTKYGKQ